MILQPSVYKKRRAAYMQKMAPGGLAIFASAPLYPFSRDITYAERYGYQQDRDFYYLTGFPEPEAICLLAPQQKEHQFVLFVRPHDSLREVRDGKRAGVDGAISTYGADVAYPIDQFEAILPRYLDQTSALYYSPGQHPQVDRILIQFVEQYRIRRAKGMPGPGMLIDAGEILDELRLIKQEEELGLLRRAAQISAEAHCEAMKSVRAGAYEYEVQATIEYTFRKRGALANAFPTIVASGPNSAIPPYRSNNRLMQNGEVVLIDAGAEYHAYAADITRTLPVDGHFSPEQRDLYQLVFTAQETALQHIRPGVRLQEMYLLTAQIITEGLLNLGLLRGTFATLFESGAYRAFYPHPASHWIGLDVRDRGKYMIEGESRLLEVGMVFTLEPGIYIPEHTRSVDPRYWNIGIRLEDVVSVTPTGVEILTDGAPRTIEMIEEMMAR